MTLRTLFLLELVLGFLACQVPPPVIDPEPDFVIQRDEFDYGSKHFQLGQNPGSTSYFDSTTVVLSAQSGSGCVFSNGPYKLVGTSIEVGLYKVSEDFCLELSPTLDPKAEAGFYREPTRIRAYIYDTMHRLHFDYKKAGVTIFNQDVTQEFLAPPYKISLVFTSDTLYFNYWDDNWITNAHIDSVSSLVQRLRKAKVVSAPRATDRYTVEQLRAMHMVGLYSASTGWKTALKIVDTWQGEWYIGLASQGKRGISIVEYLEVRGPKENFPKLTATGEIEVYYDRHPEPKIKYHPEVIGYGKGMTTDTLYQFKNLPKDQELQIFVTAEDSVGNVSDSSAVIKHKIE